MWKPTIFAHQRKDFSKTPNPSFKNWESPFSKVSEKLAKNPMNKACPYFHLYAHIHIFRTSNCHFVAQVKGFVL